ncbi:hypothetical protein BC835DRAFT_1308808 [Cytidiella melzeri]|nr:hypothetical protein BC835DRAFT_1308808 [Cytidiella melzeri]
MVPESGKPEGAGIIIKVKVKIHCAKAKASQGWSCNWLRVLAYQVIGRRTMVVIPVGLRPFSGTTSLWQWWVFLPLHYGTLAAFQPMVEQKVSFWWMYHEQLTATLEEDYRCQARVRNLCCNWNIQLYLAESNSGTLSRWRTLALTFSISDAMLSKLSAVVLHFVNNLISDILLGSQEDQIGRSWRDGSAGSLLIQTWPSGRGRGPGADSIHAKFDGTCAGLTFTIGSLVLTAPPETDINGAGSSVVNALLSPTAEIRLRISSRSASCFNSARTNIVSRHSFAVLQMFILLRFVVVLWLVVLAEVEGGRAGVSIGPKNMGWRLLARSQEATGECPEECNAGITRPNGSTKGVHQCNDVTDTGKGKFE